MNPTGALRKGSESKAEEGKDSQWNVQVVKVNTRCFWNACKALSFGLVLMLIGTTMATLGYYADQLSVGQEMRGNTTVRVKHETRGFHLNNLSYAGPIVMGVGGFIVVAACVMTFEARDSAAKVVPARNKYGAAGGGVQRAGSRAVQGSVRSGTRAGSWYRGDAVLRAGSPCPSENRRALTAAFVQFSRNLQYGPGPGTTLQGMSKSPSAPNLADKSSLPRSDRVSPRSVVKRSRNSLHPMSGCALLSPHALLHRQALSMDNPDYMGYFSPPRRMSRDPSAKQSGESVPEMELGASAALTAAAAAAIGSQASMVMDLHMDCPVTLRVKDRTRRSDTSRRHQLARQTPVEDEEAAWERRETHSCSPRLPGYHYQRAYEDYVQSSSHGCRSTPHSRRESIVRGGSGEEYVRSRSNTGESMRRHSSVRRSRRHSSDSRRRQSTYSRSGSERSTQPPTPHDPDPYPIVEVAAERSAQPS